MRRRQARATRPSAAHSLHGSGGRQFLRRLLLLLLYMTFACGVDLLFAFRRLCGSSGIVLGREQRVEPRRQTGQLERERSMARRGG